MPWRRQANAFTLKAVHDLVCDATVGACDALFALFALKGATLEHSCPADNGRHSANLVLGAQVFLEFWASTMSSQLLS